MLEQKKNYFTVKNLIFFATVWIFYSLNSREFKIPNADILRWFFLGALIIVAYFTGESLALKPPTIVLFFVVAVAPSLLNSINQKESLIKFLSFIVVVWGNYIYFSSLETKEDMELALKIIMIVMIVFEIQNLIIHRYDGDRLAGNTTNPNTLGVYSNLSFLAAYFWFSNTQGIKKFVFLGLMGVSVYLAVMSVSRTAFVTICVNIFFCLFIQFRKSGFSYLLLLPALLVFILAMTGNLQFLGIEALNRLTEEGSGRDELWEKGINVWKSHPVFGCGYDVSLYLNDLDEFYYPFHNSYISILAEIGIWGVTILGICFINDFFRSFREFLNSLREEKISFLSFSVLMMIELLIAAWSESFLFAVGSTEACTFWMIFVWTLVFREKFAYSEELKMDNDSEVTVNE